MQHRNLAGPAFAKLAFAMVLLSILPLRAGQPEATGTGMGGGIITLYARDALSQKLCLADGQYGNALHGNMVTNRCGDLDFEGYNPGNLTTGIEGRRVAEIIDLGTEAVLADRYHVRETVGGGQAFASIKRSGQRLYIAPDGKELAGADALFGKLRSGATVPIQVGHIYVLRIADEVRKGEESPQAKETCAKLLVVSYAPGESVTIRWQLL